MGSRERRKKSGIDLVENKLAEVFGDACLPQPAFVQRHIMKCSALVARCEKRFAAEHQNENSQQVPCLLVGWREKVWLVALDLEQRA
jgi:hypothetical protein